MRFPRQIDAQTNCPSLQAEAQKVKESPSHPLLYFQNFPGAKKKYPQSGNADEVVGTVGFTFITLKQHTFRNKNFTMLN